MKLKGFFWQYFIIIINSLERALRNKNVIYIHSLYYICRVPHVGFIYAEKEEFNFDKIKVRQPHFGPILSTESNFTLV